MGIDSQKLIFATVSRRRCLVCDNSIPGYGRVYCSEKCRQKAWRDRHFPDRRIQNTNTRKCAKCKQRVPYQMVKLIPRYNLAGKTAYCSSCIDKVKFRGPLKRKGE